MLAKKRRLKVPNSIDAELVYKSNFQCCVCQKKGDHTHHLDSKQNNNDLNNLALLCFDHHNLATITNSLSKKLSKEAIIKYRDHHYNVIEKERQRALGVFNNSIYNLSEETLLTVTKNALIILELEKIKEKYFRAEWANRIEILDELGRFVNHSNYRLAYEIISFFSFVASGTRGGMPYDLALSIHFRILDFYPMNNYGGNGEQLIELAKQCIYIGNNIAYDSFIHLRSLSVAMCGLSIIKFIYREAKQNDIKELQEEVNRIYDELNSTLKRPERKDLDDALEMLGTFRDDLKEWDLSFPLLSPRLMKIIDQEENVSSYRTNSVNKS